MSRRFAFVAVVALAASCSGTSNVLAQNSFFGRNLQSLNRYNQANTSGFFGRNIPSTNRNINSGNSFFGRNVPSAYRNNTKRNTANYNRNNTSNKKTPTELVLDNLRVAQTDLDRKNTSDVLRQLQGSENILSSLVKNPNGKKTDDIEKALKDVKDARASVNSKKLDDASTSIADAITALRGNDGNQKNKNNK
jgi:hypothetical protein